MKFKYGKELSEMLYQPATRVVCESQAGILDKQMFFQTLGQLRQWISCIIFRNMNYI